MPTGCSGVGLNIRTNAGNRGSYYDRFRFHVSAQKADKRWVELVDGGPTDWTKKLLNNAMEKLLTSGIGSERLCVVFSNPS